jgi:SNF family Na+-dependent transporter
MSIAIEKCVGAFMTVLLLWLVAVVVYTMTERGATNQASRRDRARSFLK